MNEIIRDGNSRAIGSVETRPNGDRIVRNYSNRVIATYDAKNDVTRAFDCSLISRGDTAVGQLYNKRYNPEA